MKWIREGGIDSVIAEDGGIEELKS